MTAPAPDRVLTGIAARIGSVTAFSVMYAVMKLAEARGAVLVEVIFFRQAAAILPVLVYIAIGPGIGAIRTQRFSAQVLRAGIGLVSMGFSFFTVLLLPLAEATTLQFTLPIFATILGALALREPTGWYRWGAVALGFAGVLVIAKPGTGAVPVIGLVCGLIGTGLSATVSILLRQIGRYEAPATTVFWFSALSIPPLGLIYAFHFSPHDAATWALLVTTGLLGGTAQLFMTASLKLAPVTVVTPIDYLGLLWAALLGWLCFNTLPDLAIWIGAPMIIGSGLIIVWRERVRHIELTNEAIASG